MTIAENCPLDIPLCSRCVNCLTSYSSLFGNSESCTKGVRSDVYDNDWHHDQGEPIVPCEHYVFGSPQTYVYR